MTNMVKQAIAALRTLPEERRAAVARAIIDYASYENDEVYHLSEGERQAVHEGLEVAERGKFV